MRGGVGEAGGGDLVAVAPLLGTGQGAEHRAQRDVRDTELVENADRVGLAGRLHDPGQDQLLERRDAEHVKPQPGVGTGEHGPQQRAGLARDHRLPRRHRARAQVQLSLPREDLASSRLQQRGQLGIVVGRPEVLQDLVPTALALSDLQRRRPGRGPDFTNEHHQVTLPTRFSVSQPFNPTR